MLSSSRKKQLIVHKSEPLKSERHTALLTLLESRPISSQKEVVRALQQQGFEVTQPSVCRDFKELSIVKLSGRYLSSNRVAPQTVTAEHEHLNVFSLVKSLNPIGDNLIVIKTERAGARPVAVALDRMNIPGNEGTIAGDDTIFMAVRTRQLQSQLVRTLTRTLAQIAS